MTFNSMVILRYIRRWHELNKGVFVTVTLFNIKEDETHKQQNSIC